MSRRVLLLGSNGQVGWRLRRSLVPHGEVIALTRDVLNLASLDAVRTTIRDLRPDVVVNAAAYTAVDQAEKEPDLARIINAAAPQAMAEELVQTGGVLVHYSTDYVFNGSKRSPYVETDGTTPLNVYGRSKLEGEQMIATSGCAHLILRTSWVYDTRGKNFLLTILRLAREREELRIVADQVGAPTWAQDIAESTASMVGHMLAQRTENVWPHGGTYHLTAAGQTSWAEFAEAILDDYRAEYYSAEEKLDTVLSRVRGYARDPAFDQPIRAQRVLPITTAEYPTPAVRPGYSVLSNDKLHGTFGVAIPEWRSRLRVALQQAIHG